MTPARLVTFLLVAALAAVSSSGATGPQAAAAAFYRAHFARRDLMPISREGVARAKPFLTARLHGLLVHELDRADEAVAANGGPGQFKPFVVGDVFTGSEELPDDFRIGRSAIAADAARVPVTSTWRRPNESGDTTRDVTAVLRREGGRWLVDDVVYPDGNTLVDLLSRPEYDSYGT